MRPVLSGDISIMLRINEAIKRILTLLTAAAVMVSVSGCYLLPDEEEVLPAPTVKASTVSYTTVFAKRKTLEKKIVTSGTVSSAKLYNVAYEKDGGTIAKFHVRAGQQIQKGDPICELDTADIDYKIQLKELDRKRAYLNTVVLYEKNCTQAEYDKAYVDVTLLDIELKKLKEQQENAVLVSPADGVVSALANVRIGDYASPGQTIATIMKTSDLYIAIQPSDFNPFKIGTEVVIRLGEKEYTGEVFMNPDALKDYKAALAESREKPEEGGIDFQGDMIYLRFKDEIPADAVGQLVDTILVLDRVENGIVISNNLVKTVDGEKIVYVLKDGEKVATKVEVGLKTGSQCEILSGINEGDELIIG